jgi:hypothetical protein
LPQRRRFARRTFPRSSGTICACGRRASSAGLPETETLDEFLRLFPEEEPAAAPAPAPPAKPGWQRIVEMVQAFFGDEDDDGTPKPVAGERPWTSDAKRVQPRDQGSRIRIRIKVTP